MSIRIALIRGINVGTAKRVAMAELKSMVASFGYRDVRALLNSGNVVFDAPASVGGTPRERIETGLAEKLGVAARVVVVTAAQLDEIVTGNTLAKAGRNPSRLMVHVFASPATAKKLGALDPDERDDANLVVGRLAAYVWCPDGVLASDVGAATARCLGDAATARNWGTILKLQAMASA